MFDDAILFKRKHARLAIAAPLVIALVSEAALLCAVAFVAWSSDRSLAVQQHGEISAYVGQILKEEQKSTLDYALWDELAEAVASDPVDREFLVEDFATATKVYADATTTAILGADGRAIFVAKGDEEAGDNWYRQNCPRCDAIAARVQTALAGPKSGFFTYSVSDTYSARKELPADFPAAVEFVLYDGAPAIVSAAPVDVEDPGSRSDGPHPVAVVLAPFETAWMKDMRTDTGIASLRLAPVGDVASDEGIVLTASADGTPIGRLEWDRTTPAMDLLLRLAPFGLAFAVVFTAVVVALSRWLKRMAVDQVAGEALGTHHATHDTLTGLGNRAYLAAQLDVVLPQVREAGRSAALLLLDLDGFKGVNDTYGHAAGDDLICQFADRLVRELPAGCRIARLGGDEFAVLMPSIANRQEAEAVGARVLVLARTPFDVDGVEARVGCSVGVALAPEQATDRSDWMRKADIALYRAKGEGRNRVRVFANEFDQRARERREAEERLRAALADTDRFDIVYRPIVSLTDGSAAIRGREAILHLREPDGRRIAAKAMIRMAEEEGLSAEIGSFVLRRVAMDAPRFAGEPIRIAAPPGEVADPAFADRVLMILDETGLPARRLEIALSDGLQHAASPEALRQLTRLRAAGVGLCLDGFGAGYANLSQLRALPLDRIRIAPTLVRGVAASPEARYIVAAVVDLARSLGLEVAADGVERPEELAVLRSLGCTEVPGAAPAARLAESLSEAAAA